MTNWGHQLRAYFCRIKISMELETYESDDDERYEDEEDEEDD